MAFITKLQYNSPVVLTYTFIALIALIMGYFTNNVSTTLLFSVYRSSFSDPLFYLRLFTHVIGHASFEHFFNNFLIILLIGPMLEEKYGSKNLLIIIIITAFITGILHVILFNTMLLGASGIVFSMMLLGSYANFEKGRIPITLLLIICIFIGKEFFNIFYIDDNVSRITHIFGGIIGAVCGYCVNHKKKHA